MKTFLCILLFCVPSTSVLAASTGGNNSELNETVFKYGSIGTDHIAGIPYDIWRVMPTICRDKLPNPKGPSSFSQFGFLQEPGQRTPIGITVTDHAFGTVRTVGINCATCHTSTYRSHPNDQPKLVYGMPSGRLDVMNYSRFVFECLSDSDRVNISNLVNAWADSGERSLKREIPLLPLLSVLRSVAQKSLDAFKSFQNQQPRSGVGRDDSVNVYKALFFGNTNIPQHEAIANVDYMSIWNGKIRSGMASHWDGSIPLRFDRDMLVAISTSTQETFPLAYPFILKQQSNVEQVESWLATLDAPAYPEKIDANLIVRGEQIYQTNCATCHGTRAERFGAPRQKNSMLGQIVPTTELKTDSYRLNSLTPDLLKNLESYIATLTGEASFVKTQGYMNNYLDGIYLRGPYLHNGSVPTLADLLSLQEKRPIVFWRGSDILDHKRIGFLSREDELKVAKEDSNHLFRYDTRLAGNSNQGHLYGTQLNPTEKLELLEYLKTF